MNIENFDDLFVGYPEDIEKNLTALLPEAQALEDKSIYLQFLSKIALAKAMQGAFAAAHQTLDEAEKLLKPRYALAKVRIILERGRCFQQEGIDDKALPVFKESYELAKKHGFDLYTIDAAHMVAILEKDPQEKIRWNVLAINLAMAAKDEKAKAWLVSLHNNLAQNYVEVENFQAALQHFQKCKKYVLASNYEILLRDMLLRGARWGIARAKRGLGLLDEALNMQKKLLREHNEIVQNKSLPIEMIRVGRGLVCEELAELHLALSQQYAGLCLDDLLKDPWSPKMMAERLARMKTLKGYEVN